MKKSIWVLVVGIVFTACKQNTTNEFLEMHADNGQAYTSGVEGRTDVEAIFAQTFEEQKVDGVFVLVDSQHEELYISDDQRATTEYLPASTFKIFNALVALETGAVKNIDEVVPWDRINRDTPGWNENMNMRTAFERSAIWFFQEMARRIGEDRMQEWVEKAKYGNQTISGGLDRFWLTGDIRISPYQQVRFLESLYNGSTPFSEETVAQVKELMHHEQIEGYTLYGKTGLVQSTDPMIGWFVGFLEKGEKVYFFSCNMDVNRESDKEKRLEITKEILKKLELI